MRIKEFNKGVIRTPLFPFNSIKEILEAKDENWLDSELIKNQFFRKAIYLASPELFKEFEKIHELDKNGKKFKNLKKSILKYATRICTRPTPFGVFSGISAIQLDGENSTVLDNIENFNIHTQLDMNFSVQLGHQLSQNVIIQNHILFYPNTSIYEQGDYYRLVYYSFNKDQVRNHELMSFEKNEYLDILIRSSKKGLLKKDLVKLLENKGVDSEDANSFLQEIINSQILVSDLEPSTIGQEIEFQIKNTLDKALKRCADKNEAIFIEKVIVFLDKIITKTLSFSNQLDSIIIKDEFISFGDFINNECPIELTNLNEKFLIQSNLNISFINSNINKEFIEKTRMAIEIVNRFNQGIIDENSRINKFKKAFFERYEEEDVPLLEILDVESGLGYGANLENENIDISPLIDNIPSLPRGNKLDSIQWHKKNDDFWNEKINDAILDGDQEIVLSKEDIGLFERQDLEYSSTFTAKISLLKKRADNYIHFDFYGGSSATSWIGRFCNSNNGINDLAQSIVSYEKEDYSDCILVEIDHLPESRLGNVILRPLSREKNIRYLGGVADENTISLDDITVSVKKNKIRLKSKKNKKHIIPYFSNAYNISNPRNLPVFQFLADIGKENNSTGGSLDLSKFHKFNKFIPRLRYDNIIFKRATWYFNREDFNHLLDKDDDKLKIYFLKFRQKYCIPKYFVLKQGDNELLIYSEKTDSIKILLKEVKKHSSVMLAEFLLDEFESGVTNFKGEEFNNELLIFYMMQGRNKNYPDFINNNEPNIVTRSFLPGDEWVYYKVYLGVKAADKLILFIYPMLNELLEQNYINEWFFIRYHDPKFHIRLRVKVKDLKFLGLIMTKIKDKLKSFDNKYKISSVKLDTYNRELIRYGNEKIEFFEKIFYYDSIMCVDLISYYNEEEFIDDYWVSALYSCFTYCELFELSNQEIITFLKNIKVSFENEFNAYKETTKEINSRYNKNKKMLSNIFLNKNTQEYGGFISIIESRNNNIKPLIVSICEDISIEEKYYFLNSLIHMNINRMFRTNQRLYEFVLTDFHIKIRNIIKHLST